MEVKNLGDIEAIAFDIDGTLYAQWQLTIRAIFRYLSHGVFFLHYGIVRHHMHGIEPLDDFYKVQAQKMAERLKSTSEDAEKRLDEIVYSGLKKYFTRIPCYNGVPEAFKAFKEAGFKLALLSDFPPDQKGDIWGVRPYCDVILGTEALGALKPEPYSFLEMAKQLGVAPEKILYVGNSKKYDVQGAMASGMKSAYLLPWWRRIFNKKIKGPDICFSSYRQLQDIVLQ